MKKLAFACAGLLGLALSHAALAAGAQQPTRAASSTGIDATSAAQLDKAVAGSWRSPENKARDMYRHPQQTLSFFGVRPDMTVIEIWPSGGWFTEILAPYLHDNGHYIGAVEAGSKSTAALQKKFSFAPAQYGNAKIMEFNHKAPVLGAPGSADRVLTFRNVHNWAADGSAEAMFKAMFAVLKPGGVLGVEDHRADAGKKLDDVVNSGYLPTDYVIKLATDAGFKLDAQSEINANPKDDHNHPKGVWTLPPSFDMGDTDKAKWQAIGESDRMTLRFVKPAAAK
ncbi:class I SAM-dependent methyltransferase [Luteibacter sp. 9135]|uniref:class I SAM-dependent methyltransferase n=1 Tax=Luteibacter sp. 9135 TaxID=1500893 RepID=UPI0009DC9462|nr:class I SAM-dependent methyltransferase [Luteibacter sp. 9135]